jgi:hypothetical protein
MKNAPTAPLLALIFFSLLAPSLALANDAVSASPSPAIPAAAASAPAAADPALDRPVTAGEVQQIVQTAIYESRRPSAFRRGVSRVGGRVLLYGLFLGAGAGLQIAADNHALNQGGETGVEIVRSQRSSGEKFGQILGNHGNLVKGAVREGWNRVTTPSAKKPARLSQNRTRSAR